jgi:hypothetical protein
MTQVILSSVCCCLVDDVATVPVPARNVLAHFSASLDLLHPNHTDIDASMATPEWPDEVSIIPAYVRHTLLTDVNRRAAATSWSIMKQSRHSRSTRRMPP